MNSKDVLFDGLDLFVQSKRDAQDWHPIFKIQKLKKE